MEQRRNQYCFYKKFIKHISITRDKNMLSFTNIIWYLRKAASVNFTICLLYFFFGLVLFMYTAKQGPQGDTFVRNKSNEIDHLSKEAVLL